MVLQKGNGIAWQPLVVGLGEILFDCFPHREELGGAPLNVAIHANALLRPIGGIAIPVSRVGNDRLGDCFVVESEKHGLLIDHVQRTDERLTGRADVTIDRNGDAEYRFDADSAWDATEYDSGLATIATDCDAVAFGTLAQRCPASRETIRRFLADASQAIRLFDANLRQQFYSAEIINSSLRLASAAKFNRDELVEVCGLLDIGSVAADGLDQSAQRLASVYELDWVALTQGAQGTVLYLDGKRHDAEPVRYDSHAAADTVGAGDACSAGLLCGMLMRWPIDKTLDLANHLGAFVASQPGATPHLPDELRDRLL